MVRPASMSKISARLQSELETIFLRAPRETIPGLEKLNAWQRGRLCNHQRVRKSRAVSTKRYGLRVLALDLGAATLAAVYTDGNRPCARCRRKRAGLRSRSMAGARWHRTRGALAAAPRFAVDEAHAHLLNQALRPWTTPTLAADRAALNAAAHEAIVAGLAAVAEWSNPRRRPRTVERRAVVRRHQTERVDDVGFGYVELARDFSIAADATGIAPAFGALAAINPEAARKSSRATRWSRGYRARADFWHLSGEGPVLASAYRDTARQPSGSTGRDGFIGIGAAGTGEKARVEIRR